MEDVQNFVASEKVRVQKIFGKKHHPNETQQGFIDRHTFANWYIQTLTEQEYKCYYCSTSISVIRDLIETQKLKSRRVKGEAVRGKVLEIDKKINDKGYSADNCVLACYYCNNDKSSIFDSDDYKKSFGLNRNSYFLSLSDKKTDTKVNL
jgi:hypothetical protein